MAIIYRMSKDTRTHTAHPGKWFPHAVNMGTIETDQLARLVQRNCSVKRSDVTAVIIELSEVIQQLLSDSHRVRLDGIGSLMAGISSDPCDKPEEFSREKLRNIHLCFKPEKDLRMDNVELVALPLNIEH